MLRPIQQEKQVWKVWSRESRLVLPNLAAYWNLPEEHEKGLMFALTAGIPVYPEWGPGTGDF